MTPDQSPTSAVDQDAVLQMTSDMAEIIVEALSSNEQLQHMLASCIVAGLRRRYGGEKIYIPKTSKSDRRARDAAILAAFNGRNLKELCRQHGISLPAGYRIITRK